MTVDLADVPLWAALLAAAFLIFGSVLSLIGAFGLVRMSSFYDRLHAPTLATSWGTGGMVMGSMIVFTAAASRPVLHEILIGVFVTFTTPITLMMLGRAAVFRDRIEGSPEVPAFPGEEEAAAAPVPAAPVPAPAPDEGE